MTRDVQTQYRQDESSRRIHLVLLVNGEPMSSEADNLDDSGAFREITEAEALSAPRDLRCLRCFPEVPEPA